MTLRGKRHQRENQGAKLPRKRVKTTQDLLKKTGYWESNVAGKEKGARDNYRTIQYVKRGHPSESQEIDGEIDEAMQHALRHHAAGGKEIPPDMQIKTMATKNNISQQKMTSRTERCKRMTS